MVDHRGESILLADIPGLIEGAHAGKGLGHDFLRHVERTKAVLHLIDVYGADPLGSYQTIRSELEKYSEVLAGLPEVIAFTKCEGLDDDIQTMLQKDFAKLAKNKTVHFISSQAGLGIEPLLDELRQTLQTKTQQEVEERPDDIHVFELSQTEKQDSWHIRRKSKRFIITGTKIETFAQKTYFDDFHSVQRLEDIMHKFGILKQLDSMGYEPGQAVVFGDPEIGRITL